MRIKIPMRELNGDFAWPVAVLIAALIVKPHLIDLSDRIIVRTLTVGVILLICGMPKPNAWNGFMGRA